MAGPAECGRSVIPAFPAVAELYFRSGDDIVVGLQANATLPIQGVCFLQTENGGLRLAGLLCFLLTDHCECFGHTVTNCEKFKDA
jgi:hypothetical protein